MINPSATKAERTNMNQLQKSQRMDKVVSTLVEAVAQFQDIPTGHEQIGFLTALRDVVEQGNALAAKYYAETFPSGTLDLSPAIIETLSKATLEVAA